MGTLDATATGFNAALVVGMNVYMVPDGHHDGALPTFVLYDATKAVNDPTAYQFVDAPVRGGALGDKYGWCEGVFDGTYAYYVPDQDETLGRCFFLDTESSKRRQRLLVIRSGRAAPDATPDNAAPGKVVPPLALQASWGTVRGMGPGGEELRHFP